METGGKTSEPFFRRHLDRTKKLRLDMLAAVKPQEAAFPQEGLAGRDAEERRNLNNGQNQCDLRFSGSG